MTKYIHEAVIIEVEKDF